VRYKLDAPQLDETKWTLQLSGPNGCRIESAHIQHQVADLEDSDACRRRLGTGHYKTDKVFRPQDTPSKSAVAQIHQHNTNRPGRTAILPQHAPPKPLLNQSVPRLRLGALEQPEKPEWVNSARQHGRVRLGPVRGAKSLQIGKVKRKAATASREGAVDGDRSMPFMNWKWGACGLSGQHPEVLRADEGNPAPPQDSGGRAMSTRERR